MNNWSKAVKNGDKHYFTGKPCKRGHVALRFTKGGGCVDCNYIRLMRYSNNLDHLTDNQILAKRGNSNPSLKNRPPAPLPYRNLIQRKL